MQQTDGKVMAVVIVFVLAVVAVAVALFRGGTSSADQSHGDEAIYTAQDLHAAMAAATLRAQHQAAQAAQATQEQADAVAASAASAKAQWRAERQMRAGHDAPATPPVGQGSLMPMPAPQALLAEPALQGSDGLALLVRQGVLRRASPGDLGRWLGQARRQGAGLQQEAEQRLGRLPAYVITGAMRVPDGLAGAHSVVFLIDGATPHPMGDLGHSVLLDTDTGGCMGMACAAHLR